MIAPAATLSAQQAAPTTRALTIPIVGSGGGGTFNGVFTLQRFATQNGQHVAVGNVSEPSPTQRASWGPFSIGLQINLSRVVLDITAQPGPGNLLGNRLCGVANLLNNPGGLATLLNQILAAL